MQVLSDPRSRPVVQRKPLSAVVLVLWFAIVLAMMWAGIVAIAWVVWNLL